MIAGRSILAVIPARGGSKGLPRKNIAPVGGRPLLAWTIDAARGSTYIDRLILSSDDNELIAIARALGCEAPFRRPDDLARDDTPGIEPVLHALREVPGHDLIVLLQPTSPLRIASDIDGCLERLIATNAPACVSVREAVDHPYWTYRATIQGKLEPFFPDISESISRRQDLPRACCLNGAVYVAKVPWLLEHRSFIGAETVAFEMPASRSLDVDTADDIVLAEAALLARA